MRRIAIIHGMLIMVCTGCMSFSSTGLKRFDDNAFSGESDGHPRKHGQARPFKGVPITLKVPTHLDVFVDETYFIQRNAHMASEILNDTRILHVRTNVIKSDKVFTVDFKRPASGTLSLNMNFDEEEQYFKKIVSQLEDTTITDTAALIKTVIGTATKMGAETSEADIKAILGESVIKDKRVVAFQRFDINSPTFESDVECFVNTQLNNCNNCGTPPTYDHQ